MLEEKLRIEKETSQQREALIKEQVLQQRIKDY